MKFILSIFIIFLLPGGNAFAQKQVRKILVDYNLVKGNTPVTFNECIGAGRANEGLRADWQQQLSVVKKDIGFRYIRFHELLQDDMRVYTEDKEGHSIYNWQYIDKLFDFLLSIKIKPFVEFGFMPPDLAAGTKTIFWWKANVSKPKSYPKWDSLITALVSHWKERYGDEEIRKWYFEVWNEPDLRGFYDGTQQDYFELYNHTSKAVKSVSENYRIGGPATSATKWISEFLSYCDSSKLPVDFISTHDYGTTSVLDELGTKKQQLKTNYDTISLNVKRVRALINNSSFKNAELHFTEWNTSPSSRDPIHDSYQNAAYILNTLKQVGNVANSMSYWTFTDIFEEAGPGLTPFHGGFGLMNLQGIKKPTYYVYKYLNELGDKELTNEDSASFICKGHNGDFQALLWNFNFPETGNLYDQGYFIKLQPPVNEEQTELKITNIKDGKYKVEVFLVGYKYNDVFSAYYNLGRQSQITLAQQRILENASPGMPVSSEVINISDGIYTKKLTLRDNDIAFIKMVRV